MTLGIERIPGAVAHAGTPAEESAGLAEAAVPRAARDAAVRDPLHELVDVGGPERPDVRRERFRGHDPAEAAQGLGVRLGRSRALPLNLAGQQVLLNGLRDRFPGTVLRIQVRLHPGLLSARRWTLCGPGKSSGLDRVGCKQHGFGDRRHRAPGMPIKKWWWALRDSNPGPTD